MNNYFDVINERFSCRDFKDEKIKKEELTKILEAFRLAPTACNFQPQLVYVVEDEKYLEATARATRFTFNAKTILCVCYDKNKAWVRKQDLKNHGIIDATIAAHQAVLAATALNIGSCYVCALNNEILREALEIADNHEIVCLIPLGYPTKVNEHNTRKDIEEFVINR